MIQKPHLAGPTRLAAFTLAILCAVAASACARPSERLTADRPDLNEIADNAVSVLMSDPGYQAVSAAILIDGALHTFHYGKLESGESPDDTTLYEIGSITKTYTGLLLAQAVRDGRIALDEPASHYLPEVDFTVFEQGGQTVTIRHLATHLSGMPTDLACVEPDMTSQVRLSCFFEHDRDDLLERVSEMRLLSTPGETYRYSNAGIRLLGYILENIYGASHQQLVERFVFARTGQTDTHFRLESRDMSRFAVGRRADGDVVPDANAYVNPAGGMKTSLTDFGLYMTFYLSSDHELAEQASTLLAGDPSGLGRAYVWNTFRLDTEGMLYHGGGTFGTSSWVSLYPREGLGVFLVTPYVSDDAQARLNETVNRMVAALRPR